MLNTGQGKYWHDWEMQPGMKEKKSKKVYLEMLRLIAIFGVLFCHTENAGVHHYVETTNPVNYWFGIFCASVVQYCIPLFFMITGATLLNREETIFYVYRHRVLKMVIVTILTGAFQYLWIFRGHFDSMEFSGYLRLLYVGSMSMPMWFLFAYISLLLVLPFLQRLVRVIPEKSWFIYLFLGWIFLNDMLAVVEHCLDLGTSPLEFPILRSSVLCAMTGYFVEYRSEDFFYKKKNIFILCVISTLLTAVSMYVNYKSLDTSSFIAYGQLFAPVYALVIFVAVRNLCHRWSMPQKLESLICFAGAGVFGTYLVEAQLRDVFYPVYVKLGPVVHAYPAAFAWVIVCMLAGILLFNVIKRIPWIGKLF